MTTQTQSPCTISVSGQGTCGKPAVHTWTSTVSGREFGECAEHHVPVTAPVEPEHPEVEIVRVRHIGVVKVGRVVRRTPTRVQVEVPIRVGTGRSGIKAVWFAKADVSEIS